MRLRTSSMLLGTALGLVVCLPSPQVEAHWCNDMWVSAYNLVVRPESDTVSVPSSGSGSLVIYVQNNMDYLLPNFALTAKASGATITATPGSQKVNGTLLPGERVKYTLAITKSGGGEVKATDIDFSVCFGTSSMQCNRYGAAANSSAKAAIIKQTDGSLFPTPPPPGLSSISSGQGLQLVYSATVDYGDTNDGLDKLMQLYCAGRGSWNSGSFTNIKSNCPDVSSSTCPTTTPGSGNGDKFSYPRLWSAGHLAIRKAALGSRLGELRKRLQCGVNDANNGFAGFALMLLGYLGEDADARSFIEGKISGSGDLATIAKAALVLMGNADDLSKYKADITTGAGASSTFVKAACAAALGIAAKDDATVEKSLIPLAKWTEPDTSDNGQGLYASNLLNLVAMDRRGWAPKAGDSGAVTFYGETASGNGGGPGAGGTTGAAGSPGSGGTPGAGGASGRGGATGSGSGGRRGNGTGGSSSGNTTASGGSSSGTTTSESGGVVASGGAQPSAGGSVASGGSSGSQSSSGGTSASSNGASGGMSGSGGETSTGTTPADDGGGGCNCNVGDRARSQTLGILALCGLALLIRRRRR